MAEEHVFQWLPAYQDHELSGARCARVEAHLAGCADCRSELQSLRTLSDLLQESQSPAPQLSQGQFVARVIGRLPAGEAQPALQKMLWAAWWATPLLALLGWALQRVIGWASNVFLLAEVAGWLPWEWLDLPAGVGGAQALLACWLRTIAGVLQTLMPTGAGWLPGELGGVWSSAMLVALLASWLASWWILQRSEWFNLAPMRRRNRSIGE